MKNARRNRLCRLILAAYRNMPSNRRLGLGLWSAAVSEAEAHFPRYLPVLVGEEARLLARGLDKKEV